MDVRGVPNQWGDRLREFYASRADDPASPSTDIGRRMLAFLDGLAATDGPPLWGMTSHLALHLFPAPDSPVSVCIHGHEPGYWVESPAVGESGSVWVADAYGAIALALSALGRSGSLLPAVSPDAEPGAAADPAS
jgi:hypothetical protein